MREAEIKKREQAYRKYLKQSPILYKPLEKINRLDETPLAEVCNYVLGPGITSFIAWTLNTAMHQGKKRLYFLARDGYFMYLAAKMFCEKFQIPIECRYLCCSRYSIRIPLFHLNIEDALEYICRGGIEVTMEKILNRSGLTKDEQKEVLINLKIPILQNESIPYAKLAEIKNLLKNCDIFIVYMCKHSEEELPNLKGYLKQEGLLDDIDSAIIDSGWIGSMQKVLNEVLEKMGHTKKMEGYYWGLYELPVGVNREEYHCYYFSPERGLSEKVHFSNCLFEVIFSAPHGMTLRYEYKDNNYRPYYSEIDEKNRRFIGQIEKKLLLYIGCFLETLTDINHIDSCNDKKMIQKLIKEFMTNPTKQEVEVFGELSFSDDVLEDARQSVAAYLDQKELTANHAFNKILVMFGIKKDVIIESAWYEGSAVRGDKDVKRHIKQYLIYKYLLYIRKTFLWRKNG